MKRVILSLLMAGVMLFASACGSSAPSTSKASQLSSQYSFYGDSVTSLRSTMKITPEQADEVFLVLVKCGLNNKITNIVDSSNLNYLVWYGSDSFGVEIKDGAVSKVTKGLDEVYPEEKLHNYLMDKKLKEVEIKNDSGKVTGKYAYIKVSNTVLKGITSDHIKEFIDAYVSGSKYNWVSIVNSDDVGIQFAGSSDIYGSYGKMDNKYKVINAYGSVELQKDGTYKLPDFNSK